MTAIGLDLDASRARAVSGTQAGAGSALRLDPGAFDYPVAVGLDGRSPTVGLAGAGLARRRPHLACLDFLGLVGTGRRWSGPAGALDADGALGLVLKALRPALGGAAAVGLAVPVYLGDDQVVRLRRLAEAARWPAFATLPAPLAAALAGCDASEGAPLTPGAGLVVVGDVDGHALTWSAVDLSGRRARLAAGRTAPGLGRAAWLRRLLDGLALRCVRETRRDPRDCADAEQGLHDQLASLLDAGCPGALADLRIQGPAWFQQLVVRPEELAALTDPLARQALVELDALLARLPGVGVLSAFLLTPAAGRLPGLVPALESRLRLLAAEQPAAPPPADSADFGDALVTDEVAAPAGPRLHILARDAVARAAFDVATRVAAGRLQPAHLADVPIPTTAPTGPAQQGEPRLSYRGKDHLIVGNVFTLGRDPACDLVFESELYPTVSTRHCEILSDRRTFTLCDRSRHGTLLNNRVLRQPAALHPGDWIRLGPVGPVLRFLGQPASV